MEKLRNYRLSAKDGDIGRVRDFLLEESSWTARWLVADTGTWLMGKKVILSPVSLHPPVADEHHLPVDLTKEQIEGAPLLDEDAPVSREAERTYFHHFHWPYYWTGGGLWGGMAQPYALNPNADTGEDVLSEPIEDIDQESELRSGHELTSYRLKNGEEVLGFVEDVILDTDDWSVKYLQFDTRHWFHGKTLQVSPAKISSISWPDHTIMVDVSQAELDSASENAVESGSSGAMDSQVRALFGIAEDL
jgi:hypothetical protein